MLEVLTTPTFYVGLTSGIILMTYLLSFLPKLPNSPKILKKIAPQTSYKMMFVIRSDLKLKPAQASAFCTQGVLAMLRRGTMEFPHEIKQWKRGSQPKICLKINGEEAIAELKSRAQQVELPVLSVVNTTESPATAVLVVGPGRDTLIDQVTGHLKLY